MVLIVFKKSVFVVKESSAKLVNASDHKMCNYKLGSIGTKTLKLWSDS